MLQYIKQNKHVIMVAVTLFVVSMSTILFFFGADHKDLKADVIEGPAITESLDVKSAQEEEKTYRKLVNNNEDPVFVMNVDGTIKFASWDVESTLGYKQEDIDSQIFFLLLHPDDLSPFLGAFGKVIQNKKSVSMVGPYRIRDKNGEYHLHMGSLFPIVTDGNVEEIAISSKDISKKVKDDNRDDNQDNKKPVAPKPAPKKGSTEKVGRFLADLLFVSP